MKFSTFQPYEQSTMDKYVEKGKSLVFSRISNLFRDKKGEVITPHQTIVCRYYDSLKSYIESKTFTEEEFYKYRFNPRFLSYALYGTPELWADILYINNMVSVAEFKKTTIKIFNEGILDAIIEIKKIIENDLKENIRSVSEE